jgi:hypothetical protein
MKNTEVARLKGKKGGNYRRIGKGGRERQKDKK